MVAYMTRTGNVSLQRFAGTNPEVVRSGLARFAGVDPSHVQTDGIVDWVLARPFERGTRRWDSRLLAPYTRDILSAVPGDSAPPPAADLARVEVVRTDPWDEGEALIKHVHDLVQKGWQGCWLTGPEDHDSLLTRLEIGERLRNEIGALVVVEGPPSRMDDLAAGIASGRADLVYLTGGGDET
jgi:anthraniloyl-CoA monooxygenase